MRDQIKLQRAKITSPFLKYIPECKKRMRRLRKKIYKYLTSKNRARPTRKSKEQNCLLKQLKLPPFFEEMLPVRKKTDLNFIRNINVSIRMPLTQLIDLVTKQETLVQVQYSKWELEQLQKLKAKEKRQIEKMFTKQILSRNTISSTEQFELDEVESNSLSSFEDVCSSFYHQLNVSSHRNAQLNPFMLESGFLQMENSIVSYQNLFK